MMFFIVLIRYHCWKMTHLFQWLGARVDHYLTVLPSVIIPKTELFRPWRLMVWKMKHILFGGKRPIFRCKLSVLGKYLWSWYNNQFPSNSNSYSILTILTLHTIEQLLPSVDSSQILNGVRLLDHSHYWNAQWLIQLIQSTHRNSYHWIVRLMLLKFMWIKW